MAINVIINSREINDMSKCFLHKQKICNSLILEFTSDAKGSGVFLPIDNFCVRKPSAIFADGKYWIYADIIPWENPYWPDSYDTSIHAFSSNDCIDWMYHGEFVSHRKKDAWDYGGVATPGAVCFQDKIYIFYSGREKTDGKGWRQIGMAVADNPQGPFSKTSRPVIASTDSGSHLDDPIPIISHDGKKIELYFRQADHHLSPPNYTIKKTDSADGGVTWSLPVDVLKSNSRVKAYETVEVIRIGNETILISFDHFIKGGNKLAFRVSQDGINFSEAEDLYFEDSMCKGWESTKCGFQVVFIPDADDAFRHIGIARTIDKAGHYNQKIFPCIFSKKDIDHNVHKLI
jgi:Glycosyl hydrolases family 43